MFVLNDMKHFLKAKFSILFCNPIQDPQKAVPPTLSKRSKTELTNHRDTGPKEWPVPKGGPGAQNVQGFEKNKLIYFSKVLSKIMEIPLLR